MDCLVGVDAPLIVPPDIHRRDCDQDISRVFGHREGSAHTANRSQPAFTKGGRALALAASLHLSTDPVLPLTSPIRHMVEVYPHTALLCLLGLDKTLKYKKKQGRTIANRIDQFRGVIQGIEALTDPPLKLAAFAHWTDLCNQITQCKTQSGLDRAEDELDAYVCAYVAWYYWTHRLEHCHSLGTPLRAIS
jgi:predicted RNase H-like nuclease